MPGWIKTGIRLCGGTLIRVFVVIILESLSFFHVFYSYIVNKQYKKQSFHLFYCSKGNDKQPNINCSDINGNIHSPTRRQTVQLTR